MTKPIIDPEFHALIPPLSEDERIQLEANIRAEGCRDALVVWGEILLDGHNRFEICERLKIEYRTKEIELKDRAAAVEWIIRNQFGRRNLSAYQRAELALKLEPIIAAKAKDRMLAGKSDPVQKSSQGKTRESLASVAGVSHDTIHKAKVIAARADDETKARLRSGDTSINAEYKRLTGAHVSNNSGENEWHTPPEYIEAARKTMGEIDCDPASIEIANRIVKAKKFYTAQDDGLKQKWGKRVWMNPPYAQPLIAQFCESVTAKYESGEIEQACVLVNNATETAWFQRMLERAGAVCFVRGRIRFIDINGKAGSAPLQGQAVLYFGEDVQRFSSIFSEIGSVLKK